MQRPTVRLLLNRMKNNKKNLPQGLNSPSEVFLEENINASTVTLDSASLEQARLTSFDFNISGSIGLKEDPETDVSTLLDGMEASAESRRFKKKFCIRSHRSGLHSDKNTPPSENIRELGIRQKSLVRRTDLIQSNTSSKINCCQTPQKRSKRNRINFGMNTGNPMKRIDLISSSPKKGWRNRTLEVNITRTHRLSPTRRNRKESDICGWEAFSPY